MIATKPAGFEEIAHTADWSLRVWAPDLAGLLEQAARGMLELSGVRLEAGKRIRRRLTVEATDAEGLLVNFLAELLHLLEQEELAFDQYELDVAENVVKANLEGTRVAEHKKEIKAVTYHNLKVVKKGAQVEAELVFDV